MHTYDIHQKNRLQSNLNLQPSAYKKSNLPQSHRNDSINILHNMISNENSPTEELKVTLEEYLMSRGENKCSTYQGFRDIGTY